MIGLWDGTSFVDVTDPTNPSVLGFLPTKTSNSMWRDIKVYKDHAYIVSEARDHGMQVFDLTELRGLERRPFLLSNGTFNEERPPVLTETAWYNEFGSAHNIVINEESGFAYSVGSTTCAGGLHIVDIREPASPSYAGCFGNDGYTHDAQCVIYSGPDASYQGREICFCYNEDTLTIVDVTVKDQINMLSRIGYAHSAYTHQGWLLSDSSHLLLNDELDELEGTETHTRTMLWDVSSLKAPVLKSSFYSEQDSIDHNLYVVGDKAYLTNYCDGLRVLDVSQANGSEGLLTQSAFFDVAPECNNQLEFFGSWSNYPFFSTGTIVVSSIERGLFVLRLSAEEQQCN
jgi:choice-of-anchor B domain-containing protein